MPKIMSKRKINIKQLANYFTILFVLISLSACQTLSSNQKALTDKSYNRAKLDQQLLALDRFSVKGVIGIIYNQKADSANFSYSQKGDDFDIRLYGPLGIGSVQIIGNDNKVTLIDNKGNETQADNVQNLMMQQLGWFVPIDGLKYWIRGVSISDQDSNLELNDNNLAKAIIETGWDIKYENYSLIDVKYPLPNKMKMSRADLTIKIVIKSWQL